MHRPVSDVVDKQVTTLEGLGGDRHPLQPAFLDEQAAQGGDCTSGMIMTAAAFLNANAEPNDPAIRHALEANWCRCGTHVRILNAVARAATVTFVTGNGRAA